jgi:molecular chaperone DnaK
LKSAHEARDLNRIDTAMEALNNAWQAASQDLYNAQQAAQGGSAQGGNGSASTGQDSDVTDVEFEEMDNKS